MFTNHYTESFRYHENRENRLICIIVLRLCPFQVSLYIPSVPSVYSENSNRHMLAAKTIPQAVSVYIAADVALNIKVVSVLSAA